jgi:hypothetical protein
MNLYPFIEECPRRSQWPATCTSQPLAPLLRPRTAWLLYCTGAPYLTTSRRGPCSERASSSPRRALYANARSLPPVFPIREANGSGVPPPPPRRSACGGRGGGKASPFTIRVANWENGKPPCPKGGGCPLSRYPLPPPALLCPHKWGRGSPEGQRAGGVFSLKKQASPFTIRFANWENGKPPCPKGGRLAYVNAFR